MRYRLEWAVALGALAFAAPAMAAVDAFIWFDGVKGPSTTQPGAIELTSFSWGESNPTTIGSATGGSGAGKGRVSEIVITKSTDSASPVLVRACASGQHFSTVTLRKAGGSETYTLSDVVLSCQTGGGGSERLTLNFTKISSDGSLTTQGKIEGQTAGGAAGPWR
jgi:type VI secretion system secreted protein Hcp